MTTLENLKSDLANNADKDRAKILQRFFKTGKGEYGEGDIFLGITVPKTREIAKKHNSLLLSDIESLLSSKIHEERLCSLLILVENFKKADDKTKQKIFDFYLKNTKKINNWDLVDLSADKIIGAYISDKDKSIIYSLAKSSNLWERRIAIISTFHFIKNNKFQETMKLAEILLNDKHDLIHKAVGWMLREIGKRSIETLEDFLNKNCKKMPRTMLRYAIEKFPSEKRLKYLNGEIK